MVLFLVLHKIINNFLKSQCILLMKMKDEKIKIYPEKYAFARMDLSKQLSNYSINCGFNLKINKKFLTKNHPK